MVALTSGKLFRESPAIDPGPSPLRHLFELADNEHYLDSAATTLVPVSVIEATTDYYRHGHSNIHRAVHRRSQQVSQQYEQAREQVARFIGAPAAEQIVFTLNTTDAINQVASGFLEPTLQGGDRVITTDQEHHSNWLPWQQLCERKGAQFISLPLHLEEHRHEHQQCQIDLDQLAATFQQGDCKLFAITQASNVTGATPPLKQIIDIAHRYGVPVLVDGAQAIGHMPVDVSDLNCDFYAFSAHKAYGPTGVGVLYINNKHLKTLNGRSGGGTVKTIANGQPVWQDGPQRLEAGTPNIAGVIGLIEAIHFLSSNREQIYSREPLLMRMAWEQLGQIPGIQLLGNQPGRATLSFIHQQIHSHDIGSLLDERGIAVRTGHHCAVPLLQSLGVKSAVRCSVGAYSGSEDIRALVNALQEINDLFGVGNIDSGETDR